MITRTQWSLRRGACGQVVAELLVLMTLLTLALFTPWLDGLSPAEQLRRAVNDQSQATLIALALL